MQIANLSFTKIGWENFKKLTKKEQKDFVKARIEIKSKDLDKELKNVPYGKHSGNSEENTEGSE